MAGPPRTIGLLAPMPSEMRPLVRELGLQRDPADRVYRGALGPRALVAARTGIGTRRAAAATARLLVAEPVDHVVVVGIAGGLGDSRVGDVYFPALVVDKETATVYRAAPLGTIVPDGKLVTHDDFDMGPAEVGRLADDGFVAIDMETAAIARVCEERGCPWTAVRAISDLAGVTPGDVITLANPDGSPDIGASIRYLVTKPWRIPGLVRLARDSARAASAAARAASRALGSRN